MNRHRQRGLGIVSAIFLLVALAALGLYMLTLSGVAQTTVDRALLTARTYSAARSGLEWGIQRAVAPPVTAPGACTTAPLVPAAPTTFAPAGSGFTNIQVTVNCLLSTQTQGVTAYIYYITSTAAYASTGDPDHILRKFSVTVCRTASGTTDC